MRAGWERAVEQGQEALLVPALDVLGHFYELRGRFLEAEALFADAALRLAPPEPATTHASEERQLLVGRMLGWQGHFQYLQARYEPADALQRSIHLLRPQPAGRLALIRDLYDLARSVGRAGQYEAQVPLYQEALTLARAAHDHAAIGDCLDGLAGLAFDTGDFRAADRYWRACLAEREASGDATLSAYALSNVGEVALVLGRFDEARQASEESLAAMKAAHAGWRIIHPLVNLASLARIEGRDEEAWQLFQHCLEILRETGDRKRTAEVLVRLASVSLDRGEGEVASQLLTESRELFAAFRHPRGLALCHLGMAQAALGRGVATTAHHEAEAGLALARRTGLRHEEGAALGLLAQAAWLEDDARLAVEHAREAFAVLSGIGARPEALEVGTTLADWSAGDPAPRVALLASILAQPSLWASTRARAERLLPRLAAHLSAASLATAQARGGAAPLEALVAAVPRGDGQPAVPGAARAGGQVLKA
ncbi:MAG: tetratricopeptide repeat protein [Chloroflexi bacterium]|nr:tetratricopeptide repeat protein [Chloroflexota bacterium]